MAKRSLRMEPFEERILLAIDGPQLLAAIPATGQVINDNTTLTVAPREILLRFNQPIDPASIAAPNGLANIRVTGDGLDNTFNTADDRIIKPGYLGIEPGGAPNEVLVRFAENLPDDVYFLTVISGPTGLKSTSGKQFQDGVTMNRPFRLDLPPQVVAIVPQPVDRNPVTGRLVQAVNTIEVYFNVNDPLNKESAENTANYQLIRTGNTNGTPNPADDTHIAPQSVSYDPGSGKAILTFASGELTQAGTYRLRVGNAEAQAGGVTNISPGSAGTSFNSAAVIGNPFSTNPGTQTVSLSDTLVNVPVSGITWPGDPNGPGERENNSDTSHTSGGSNNSSTPVIIYYNFDEIGEKFGQHFANLITETQKERVREVFEYYSYYLGVQFIETATDGLTIALGNPAFLGGTQNVGGIAGGGTAIMNFSVDWGASEPRGAFFNTAMHEIGHLLGLLHNYESPAVMGGGIPDGVYPGDLDIIYGRYLWPALGNDINVYRFDLATSGRLNVETIAERLKTLNLAAQPSMLDSVITIFDLAGNIVARNDDYFGKDSFLELDLQAGTYYIAISSTGNTNFDPRVANSGADGTTAGGYQLRMSFTPSANTGNSINDANPVSVNGGNVLDGDNDGVAGGVNNFWFKTGNTIWVDKAAPAGTGPLGSINNPYTRIGDALAAAPQGSLVRIVGNGGGDGNIATTGDNLSYNIGFDSLNNPLADGTQLNVPKGVTVMVDAGTILKLRGANINVGSVSPDSINRAEGALQILGTTEQNEQGDIGTVYITSYYNNDNGIGAMQPNVQPLAQGNWGGIVFRDDSDFEANGVFLNYVNHANISWGGGIVSVEGQNGVYRAIHIESARPTITFNTITSSADAAMSATPNSFEESYFQGPGFRADYTRVGPKIYGNVLTRNSMNGLFISIQTSSQTGRVLDELTVNGRFANTDIVHILTETLLINGQPGGPGGPFATPANFDSRYSARLAIDPGTIIKSGGGRFETEMGAQLIAEGTVNRPIIFTSLYDDRFGAGGTSDTTNNNTDILPTPGDWGGFFFAPTSIGSIDRALVAFAGGEVRFEGIPGSMNPVEIHQAQVRIANSTFDFNRLAGGADRTGRGSADPSVVYIRGAQPVILNNVFQNNTGGSVISVNVNSLNSRLIDDWGRTRGTIGLAGSYPKNYGPLIRNNLIGNNSLNGMVVRGGLITTNSVWDDTDIVHVVQNTIQLDNQQTLTGTLRLQSSPTESLVVKMLGTNTDIVAGGSLLDIDDRVGGTLQIVGTPGHAVVITSLKDDTVGAGLTPQGMPQKDTLNRKGVVPDPPPNLPNSGPVILDATPRDVHGGDWVGLDGWDTIVKNLQYAYTNSRVQGRPARALVIGWETAPDGSDLGVPYSAEAIRWAAGQAGLQLTFADTPGEIAAGLANAENYSLIYVPSHSGQVLPATRSDRYDNTKWWGGVTNGMLDELNAHKGRLLDYINNNGGGLVVMAQDTADNPYGFVAAGGHPFVLRKGGGNVMTATETIAAGFGEVGYSDTYLNNGTPYRAAFKGTNGFNRLVPWAVDPVTGEIAMLGHAPGGPGIGAPRDVVAPGDWGSIRLDALSNDRNVEIVNEVEQAFTSAGDPNRSPSTAQSLGEIAKDLMSGNDNVRLGFEIHGVLSQAANSPGGADVDVYSFRGTAGTSVWLDIDRTHSALDTVVELVDANGAVIARSDNSIDESANPALLIGTAKRMQMGTEQKSVFSGPDFYTSNPKDAGMRVVLPGTNGSIGNYFVRVRSASGNLNNLTGGVTKGSYVLQVRLQEKDEFPGSTVRHSDVRYATNGIEVIGKPESSVLVANTAQTGLGNGTFTTAQNLGNLLESPSKTIDVAATLADASEVHWYKFSLNYEQIQSIAGLNDGLRTFAAMLQVNYADGLGRPDTTMSLYDETGTLLLISRDGQIADSLPRPNIGGIGSDQANLKHGSFGPLDPTMGPIQLTAGAPKLYDSNGNLIPSSVVTYYVAISSNGMLPEALTASFSASSSNPLIRLEPVDSINRIVDDRVGFTGSGITTAGSSGSLFDAGTNNQAENLNRYADDYHLGDVVMWVNTGNGSNRTLQTVNPFTGEVMTTGGLNLPSVNGVLGYDNIAMRNDGRLFAYTRGNGNDAAGQYVELNTATGGVVSSTDDGLLTFRDSNEEEPLQFQQVNSGVQFTAWAYYQSPDSTTRRLFAIGERTDEPNAGPAGAQIQTRNLLYELDPDTGQVMHLANEIDSSFQTWHPENGRSGTNAAPVGIIESAGSQIIGMSFVGERLIAITGNGELYELADGLLPTILNPGMTQIDEAQGYFLSQVNLGGQTLTSMTTGPLNVEGGRYANTLFGISTDGRMFAFDTNGNARGVFHNGATFIDTGITNAQGMVFTPFDYNLWHATTNRGTDLGHGINPSYNNNAARTPLKTPTEQLLGLASYYFGISPNPTPGMPDAPQPGAGAYASNPNLLNTYAVPGGAYGTLTSQTFDLAGYSALDKPTLYFNYFLDSDNNDSNTTAIDAFRVFASVDGVNWSMLATNNVTANNETPSVITPSGGVYKGQNALQRVQGLYDNTPLPPGVGTPGDFAWRQARVDLGDFAGQTNIRLRFQFSTAGTMGSNESLLGTGNVLKALPGNQLSNGQTFAVDGQTFTFRKGVPSTSDFDVVIGNDFTSAQVAQAIATTLDRVFLNDAQSLRFNATAGNFRLSFTGRDANPIAPQVTADIPWNATAEQVRAALAALPGIGADNVVVTGQARNWKIQFVGEFAGVQMKMLGFQNVDLTGFSGLAQSLEERTDDPNVFTSVKVVGDEIRMFERSVTNRGPMAYSEATLPGDGNGRFNHRSRDRSQTSFEGVYIDDFIIGFASRGEMVTGAASALQAPGLATAFAPVPAPTGGLPQILTGQYQLQIRQAMSYGAVGEIPGTHDLTDSFDVNDRFAQGITIVAKAASALNDGDWFSIDDGSQVLQFEFDFNGTLNNNNRVRVAITPGMSSGLVAIAIRNAINGAVTSRGFKVRAATRDIPSGSGLLENGNRVDLFDAFAVVDRGVVGKLEFNSVGDTRPLQNAPGQTIVQDSFVTHSRQVGILVAPPTGQIEETGDSFTTLGQFPVGVPGNTGSVANVATNNQRGWVPGVTIKNNLVTHSGRTGIAVLGDPNASYAYAQRDGTDASRYASLFRDVALFIPFVRVVNNTVYGAKIGIAAGNASSPTIINNIVANARIQTGPVIQFAGGAIYVDGSSGNDKALPDGVKSLFGRSVVLANIYQNNSNTVLGTSDSLSISLEANDPLFIDAANGNFYLNPGSKAIDSSVDSLLDRDSLVSVLEPLGVTRSPILAPTFDVYGQLRVDDPAVSPPAGVGGNAFKDRGAIERADFVGPTASLLNPMDNNPDDRNSLPHQVTLLNTILTDFSIVFSDNGVGIDDSTVDITKFVVRRTIGNQTTTLVPGIDYGLSYDTNSSIVRLVPSQGIWINGIYEIELVSTGDAAIKDIAGNLLQQNAPPQTRFIINLTDTIFSPWQNQTNRFDVDGNTRVNGQDLLHLINRILTTGGGQLPPVATAPPYFDVTGDGRLNSSDVLAVVNYILNPPAAPAAQVADPLASMVADASSESNSEPTAQPLAGVELVAAGLAMNNQTSSADEPLAAPQAAVPQAAAAPGEARVVDLAIYSAESVALGDEADEPQAWDDELDDILSDLGAEV